MKDRPIKLRPHHLLCHKGFRGLGYDESFVKTFEKVVRLLDEPAQLIEVVGEPDEVCLSCPHLAGGRCLKGNEKVSHLDSDVIELLGIGRGQVITAAELRALLEKVTGRDIERICRECEWLLLGLCTEAFKKTES